MDHYLVELSIAFLALVASFVLYKWHTNSSNTFDLTDILLGPDGKVSLYKVSQAVALAVSTWGFIILIQQGKLTEWYFTAYMGVWAGANVVKTVAAQITGGSNAGTH
jgi:hypothetical protein